MNIFKEIPVKLTAVSLFMILLAALVPPLAVPAALLSVAPQIIMIRNQKTKNAFFSWGIVLAVVYLLFGYAYAITYCFIFILFAAVAGKVIMENNDAAYKTVGKFALTWIGFFMLGQVAVYLIFNINAAEVIINSTESTMVLGMERYYKAGFALSQINLINHFFGVAFRYFKTGFFGWVLLTAIVGNYLLYFTLSKYLDIKKLPAINNFRPKETMVWYFIAALFLYMAGLKTGGDYNILLITGINGLIILLAGYFISGIGVFSLLAAKIGMSGFIKLFFLLSLFLLCRGILLFTAAGILDTWLNFRKLGNKDL